MRRIDVLQRHRGGVQAVLRTLPLDLPLALLLAGATAVSMDWMAQAAGIDTTGLAGRMRINGVVAVWLRTVRAWDRDDDADLSTTMRALDGALDRAEWLGRMLERPRPVPADQDEDGIELPPDEPGIVDPGVVDPLT